MHFLDPIVELLVVLAVGLGPLVLAAGALARAETRRKILEELNTSPLGLLYAGTALLSWAGWVVGGMFGWAYWWVALVVFMACGLGGFVMLGR